MRLRKEAGAKVLVLGGGAAGLAAARALLNAGFEVELLEAQSRLGGRVHTTSLRPDLPPLELGAEFLHGRHPLLVKLLRHAGAHVKSAEGPHFQLASGRLRRAEVDFESAMKLLTRMGSEPEQTVATYLRHHRRDDPRGASFADRFVRGFYVARPDVASARALGRMQVAADEMGGDEAFRVLEGYGAAIDRLARDVARKGRIRLGAVVERVRWSAGRVEVEARLGGTSHRLLARAAVVTFPISLLKSQTLRFEPALDDKRWALSKLRMGRVVKALAVFHTPPWTSARGGALRKFAFLHAPQLGFPVWWRPLPHDAPVLCGWAGGPDADALVGGSRRKLEHAAIASLARGFGVRPGTIEDSLDLLRVEDWGAAPFSRGGYATVAVGGEGAMAALGEPLANTLFFAGEATEPDHAGTVHGALLSGERAAKQVRARVRGG